MIVERVDIRDIMWEVARPVYRVYLWQQPSTLGVPREHVGYHSDEYRIREAADVHEVVEWARRTAGSDRTLTIYVEHRDSGGLGLIHLARTDPTVAR